VRPRTEREPDKADDEHSVQQKPDSNNLIINIKTEVVKMNTIQKLTVNTVAVTLLFALGGCAGMSARDRNTAIGAGVGAVGGSVLTGGSAVGTVGGAAVGGVIGNTIKK
jgi:osmotically inducible lipoprotein OsmB